MRRIKVVREIHEPTQDPSYKVRKYVSCITRGDARVEYQLNEWATAPDWLANAGYGICVFDWMTHALSTWRPTCLLGYQYGKISEISSPYRFFLADCEDEVPQPQYRNPDFLAWGDFHTNTTSSLTFPAGTMFFERVKIAVEINDRMARGLLDWERENIPHLDDLVLKIRREWICA